MYGYSKNLFLCLHMPFFFVLSMALFVCHFIPYCKVGESIVSLHLRQFFCPHICLNCFMADDLGFATSFVVCLSVYFFVSLKDLHLIP